jgi:hypothetical protein
MFYLNRSSRFFIHTILFLLSTVLSASAQAPGDCTICDPFLDDNDLVGYGQCFAEYCDSSIPVNGNIWVLMIAGLVLAITSKGFYHKKREE